MQGVPAEAGFFERAEEAAAGFAERGGFDVACVYRRVDVGIFLGIADVNGQVAGVKLDILVAGNAFDGDIASGYSQIEVAILGQMNGDLKVVARSAT